MFATPLKYKKGKPIEFSNSARTYQERLARLGWFIAVDGFYGLVSEQITRLFQRQHGLAQDGIVGPITWEMTQTTEAYAKHRKASAQGRNLICSFEGCRLSAYQDSVGIWTVGYGHTGTARPGMNISQAQAIALLTTDMAEAEQAVDSSTYVELSDNQFAALVSLTYNIGAGGYRSSTLLKKLNEGDFCGAAREFLSWNRAGGRVLEGLIRRRVAEKTLFEKE